MVCLVLFTRSGCRCTKRAVAALLGGVDAARFSVTVCCVALFVSLPLFWCQGGRGHRRRRRAEEEGGGFSCSNSVACSHMFGANGDTQPG